MRAPFLFPPPPAFHRAASAIAAAVLLLAPPPARSAPRISEFLAENADVIKDNDGDNSDYIELYNPGDTAIDLSGYSLTDNLTQPRRWIFPAVHLQPGSYLIVWASGKNRTSPKQPLHTNFRLEKNGGSLALFPPGDGPALSSWQNYPPQFTDKSYGSWQPVRSTILLTQGSPCRWHVPTAPDPGWQLPDYNDAAWTEALTGLGFDQDGAVTAYTPFFGQGGNTGEMFGVNASVFTRIPFTLTNRTNLSGLTLRIKCDDGFVAWINGARVASRYAPDALTWDSSATALTDDTDALADEILTLPTATGALRDGTNILAIQLLNGDAANVDLLMVPELELETLDTTQPLRSGYFQTATPGTSNPAADDGFTADTRFSVDRGFFDAPFTLTISCSTPGATIYYTTDGSAPTLRTGRLYTGPIPINTTTVVRAMADADARHPSNVDTQTYLFPEDVIRQSNPAGYPATWGFETDIGGTRYPIPADYAMDPGITNAPAYQNLTRQALTNTLPVIALSMEKGLFFDPEGIYANGREGSDEVPISIELLGPGWPEDYQIDGGVRIHGGNARTHPKKPLRLYFRKSYGADKLRFPVFPDSPVQRFDQLLLRPGGHDGFAVPFGNSSSLLAYHGTYLRDQFLRRSELDMGHLSPRGRYVHLYLNGLYWGIYDLHERANADFYSSHLGGEPEDWDVVHHPTFVGENYSQVDGTGESWEEVLAIADGGIRNIADYEAMARLVDIDNYIDYLIVRIWSGDYDWCSPVYLRNPADMTQEAEAGYFDNKNWYAARRTRGTPGGYQFHVWDAEMSMGTHLMLNLGLGFQPPWLSYYPPQRIAGFDSTRTGTPGSLAWPYAALRAWPPFRQKFADRLQRHMLGNGRFTTAANLARLDAMTAELDLPIVAESARWGDVNRFDPFDIALTRNDHWRPEIDWLRNTFIATRNALVLDQFKATGLFPATPAPEATPAAGTLPANTPVALTATAGAAIYYTLDGSDPTTFSPISETALIDVGSPCRWLVPSASQTNTWRLFADPANIATWKTGQNGLGYDLEDTYLPFILTDTKSDMYKLRATVYFRMEFNLSSQEEINRFTTLTLQAQYDDGFIAALNGSIIQKANAPSLESFNSVANDVHADNLAVSFASFPLNLTALRPLLRVGRNVLAIQGLNQSASSSDFLCTMRLIAQTGGALTPAPGALLYNPAQPPSLPGNVTLKARALADGEWSPLLEAPYLTGSAASRRNLVPSQIHYRPAPPTPAETSAGFLDESDFEFLELLNTSRSTVDLTNCYFTNGIQFEFNNATQRSLPPGARLILARNPAALLFRHPGLTNPAGTFTGGLSNSGERLRLQAADGSAIFDLTYSDNNPWPSSADGTGASLILTNAPGLTDPSNPRHWRASRSLQPSPGLPDATPFATWISTAPTGKNGPLDDADDDGFSNLLEYATGTQPLDATSRPSLILTNNNQSFQLTFPVNPDTSDTALLLEETTDPDTTWKPAESLSEQPASQGFRAYQIPAAQPGTRRFYRLRASLP